MYKHTSNYFMGKKVKNLYLRKGDHPLVLRSLFICRAKRHKWSNEEISVVIKKTLYKDKMSVYKILTDYIESK